MKKQIVVASNNAHKLREMTEIFTEYEVLTQKQAGFNDDVEETGKTFAENALIKARAVCKALHRITLADDSGLCVDALGGAPGVYSARYAGEHGNDKENRALLLKNMQGVTDRSAHFTCALALVTPDGREMVVEGKTFGKILLEEAGEGGFGYDSLFLSDDLQISFASASAQEKNSVSHRFRALQLLQEQCKDILG
jgi:XTP/dITP diphosphohydrolase